MGSDEEHPVKVIDDFPRVETRVAKIDDFALDKYQRAPPRAKTARDIAILVTGGFIALLLLPFALFIGSNPVTVEPIVTDLLKTVAAVFSGIEGAVVGYYFRAAEE
jgi:hypothetical protein